MMSFADDDSAPDEGEEPNEHAPTCRCITCAIDLAWRRGDAFEYVAPTAEQAKEVA